MNDRQEAIQAMAKGLYESVYRPIEEDAEGWNDMAHLFRRDAAAALDALLELLDEKGWTILDESASGGVGHYLWRLSPESER